MLVFGLLAALSGCGATRPPASPQQRIFDAVTQGKLEVLQTLLAEGVALGGNTGIGAAAIRGHDHVIPVILKSCLERYANGVNCSDALWGAAYLGDNKALVALLDKGADPNGEAADPERAYRPLAIAAREGRTESVKTLLARGADLELAIRTLETSIASLKSFAVVSADARRYIPEEEGAVKALERLRPAAVSASAPAGGMGKDELTQVVQAAVAGAVKAAAPSAPAAVESDVDRPTFKAAQRPDDFAVVVGIERYSEVPPAQFADRDAKAMRDSLAAMGYPERNIVLLQGDKATKTGLIKNLETWLPRNVNAGSTVFFYYSGHGAPDPKTGQAYLVPYDGDPQYLEDTAYPMKRLYEKLGALNVKQVIVAMDSCFSGAGGRSVLAKGTRPLVAKVDMGLAGGKNIVALTASAGDQISGTMDEQGHGAFTYYLLRGLNGAARDDKGAVTVKSVYDYLAPNVQDSARRSNRDQTPQLQDASSLGASLRLR